MMQKSYVGARRLCNRKICVAGHAHVVRGANRFDPLIRCCKFTNLLPRPVGRAIIADDDFVACDGLIEYRPKRRFDDLDVIVCKQANRNPSTR